MASTPWTLRVPETANAGIPGEFPNPVGGKLFSVRGRSPAAARLRQFRWPARMKGGKTEPGRDRDLRCKLTTTFSPATIGGMSPPLVRFSAEPALPDPWRKRPGLSSRSVPVPTARPGNRRKSDPGEPAMPQNSRFITY